MQDSIDLNTYKLHLIEAAIRDGWTDVKWTYDDMFGGIYLGGVSPKTGEWEHIEVKSDEPERCYCLLCREEMITESDQVCDKCKKATTIIDDMFKEIKKTLIGNIGDLLTQEQMRFMGGMVADTVSTLLHDTRVDCVDVKKDPSDRDRLIITLSFDKS